ncbi:unnamed protein product [Paramecium octaurelia]|uniref:Uncharacterized protein n=1 Tax=Paramecium octaurelia TaxID=43137 RepID=A0A8S1VY45_PAROT|nr:unnamed protein product [Paramecium octaurelia]
MIKKIFMIAKMIKDILEVILCNSGFLSEKVRQAVCQQGSQKLSQWRVGSMQDFIKNIMNVRPAENSIIQLQKEQVIQNYLYPK